MSLAETDLIPFEQPVRRTEPGRTLQALPSGDRRRRPRLAYALTAIVGAVILLWIVGLVTKRR